MKRLLVVLFALLLCGPVVAAEKPDILEELDLSGVITDGTAIRIAKQVEEINENKRVKSVLLTCDTPGGGVIASAAIKEELEKLRVPVVVWVNSICASGGMYVSMARPVKYIGVRTQSITGSIGVIMSITRYHRLMTEKLRIDMETYKSGKLKDAGNGSRAPEPGEVEYLQGEVQSLANDFYAIVQAGRGDKIKDWDAIKSAKIFFGSSGVRVGLADSVMSKDEALKKAKELSGSSAIYTREEFKKMSKDADEGGSRHRWEAPAGDWMSDFRANTSFFMEWIREMRRGQSIKLEYRVPFDL